MPTPTNRYMNVEATFTPTSGSPIPLKGCQGARFNDNVEFVEEGGDGDAFPTLAAPSFSNPTVELDIMDVMSAQALVGATPGTLAVTLYDSINKKVTGGGGKIITLINATLRSRAHTHGHRQVGKSTIAFGGFSSDGQTSPLSVAAI